MATITLKGNSIHTSGELPKVGSKAPDFKLVRTDLSEVSLESFAGKRKILNIFPSVDTGTCAMSVRKFNTEAGSLDNVAVINISADLPFAQARFCGVEGIKNAEALSSFRSNFASDYGLKLSDGPLAGLCSRAVLVLDAENRVIHAEQVGEIADEPNYAAAIGALKK
ncbi:MAG: thiol peroxidase [Proteobacteria bacterium]|nr:MAG: thiol peroxidase [Pseudomonadota bacterium]